MSTNSSDTWHLPCDKKINARNINIGRRRQLISLSCQAKSAEVFRGAIHNTLIAPLPQNLLRWEAVGIPLGRPLKTVSPMMQPMPPACSTYLLPFWSNHPPASPNHTSTSSSPMAGKAFAFSPDCQSRIIANCSSKVSLSESAIIKMVPGQLVWIGTIGIYFGGGFNYEGTFMERGAVLNWQTDG